MRIVKRGGWILMGVVIGALATSSISAVKVNEQPVDMTRLKVTLASSPIGTVAFVKDTKSSGCWLVLSKENAASIVAAPPEACSD